MAHKKRIFYTAKAGDEHIEHIVVSKKETPTGKRCAALVRFGKPIANFMITRAQLRSYNKGKRINISEKAIADFSTWCGRY